MAVNCELIQLKDGQNVGDWTITKKIGEGGFGAVYLCKNKEGELNALKVEAENDPLGLLKMEVYVLMELKKTKFQARHFLGLKDRGHVPGKFNYVVMTLVGKSLQELRNEAPMKKFSMGTAISVGRQCLEALEDLHNVGILHRDIKPGNYTIGRKEMNELRKIYMLDFGMARKFIKEDGTLRNPRARAGFRGTVKYAPLACHVHREQCRKDDIESWMYMLVEITCGRLPWRNLTNWDELSVLGHREGKRGVTRGCDWCTWATLHAHLFDSY
ncbi:hypothetical protein Y032_0005g2492 [Ancylostoma ceylanicum]|uniref:non-specific serine/threonine protein kinase n=1 Tax=Ancylostoma ceylanicum TaxID=53326 RepID=A0A016VRH9_9BILA|nr:hypothetical protein Y032_0005g2492 [Ancylostoma ceylanicum]